MQPIIGFDHSFEAFIAMHRDVPLTDGFFIFTALGDARIITIVVLALLFILWRHRHYAYKVGLLISLFGALISSDIIKLAVERPRPLPPIELIHESGYSFPSMHAAVSMATYGFLMYIIVKLVHPPHHRLPAMSIVALLIFLIGFSRIYLGVHYASDVMGGYAIGALFVYIGILSTRALSGRRGRARAKGAPSAR